MLGLGLLFWWGSNAVAAPPLPVRGKTPCPFPHVRAGAATYRPPAQDPRGAGYGTDIELPPGTVTEVLPVLKRHFDWERAVAAAVENPTLDPFRQVPAAHLAGWLRSHRNQLPRNFDSLGDHARSKAIVESGLLSTLPDNVLATLIIHSATPKDQLLLGLNQRLQLREGAPETLKAWTVHRDGDALEFVLASVPGSWTEARKHFTRLGETLGISEKLLGESGPTIPLHLHLSREAPIPPEAVRAFQWVLLIDAAQQGQKSLTDLLASRFTSVAPYPERNDRGVVRQPEGDPTRLELRMITKSLDQTSNTFREFLSSGTDGEMRMAVAEHLRDQLSRLSSEDLSRSLTDIGNKAPFAIADLYDALLPIRNTDSGRALLHRVSETLSAEMERNPRWESAVDRTGDFVHWSDGERIEFLGRLYQVNENTGQLTRVLRTAGFDERVHRVASILDQVTVVVGIQGPPDARFIRVKTAEEKAELEGQLAGAKAVRDWREPTSRSESEVQDFLQNLRRRLGILD